MSEPAEDVLLPAQRIYAMAVKQAMADYRAEVRIAEAKRITAVNEALAACISAMEALHEEES